MKKIISCVLALIMCVAVFASCDNQANDSNLDSAKEIIYNMYKDKATVTNGDYTVVSVVMVGTEKFTVEWAADVTQGQASDVTIKAGETETTIDVNETTTTEVVYKLTATVKSASGKSASVSFDHTIPAYKEFNYDDFKASADDDSVVVKGVVTGIISKTKGNSNNCLYLQDSIGGFYVYGMSEDPVTMGIKEGMTVKVSGAKDTYSGTYEIVNSTVEITDDTINPAAAVDYTDIYKNAKTLKDDELVGKQALLVTIRGVEVTGEETSSGYYKFKLGELESYVRISSSVCPLISDEQKAFKEGHASHTGYIANVTGVICLYDGAFYLTPVSENAFEYLSLPEKSDAEKVAFEKANLKLDSKITEEKTITLPTAGTSYNTVNITWTSDNACATVNGDKLTVTLPETDTTVKITASLVCGNEKDTQTFEILVEAAQSKTYDVKKIETPAKDTAYKFGFVQGNLGKTLYFNGELSGNYLATTANVEKAVDVYVEEVTGGYRLYFNKDSKKTYIDVYEYQTGKAGAQLTETPTCTYTFDNTTFTFFTNVGGADRYLGTYKTYETVSVSATTYITGENASTVEVSQFPTHLFSVKEVVLTAKKETAPKAGSSYKFYTDQKLAGKVLYFNGELSGNYLASSDKISKGVDVTVEEVTGGFRLFFTKDSKKIYIDIYEYQTGKAGVQLTETPTCTYTWNDAACTFVANVAGADRYLGMYKTYETFSVSATSYITGENAAVVDVSQFPAHIGTVSAE